MTYDPTRKKEYGAQDANPVVLHAKRSADDAWAYPVLQGMFGFEVPSYDSMLLTTTTGNLTHVHYVSSGSTVATILITYSSGAISHVYLV